MVALRNCSADSERVQILLQVRFNLHFEAHVFTVP